MTEIAYTVIAETDSEATMRAYVEWLVGGHIRDVIKGGAKSASLVLIDQGTDHAHRVEMRYVFGSRAEFDAYERGPAVALRAEGAALFGAESEHPIRFQRTLGGVVAVLP